jgi:hypothetical protein
MVVSFGVAGAAPFHTAGPNANDGAEKRPKGLEPSPVGYEPMPM